MHEIDGMKAIDYARAVRNKKALGGPEEVDPTLASDISQPLSEEERSRPVDMSYAARTGDYTGLPFASSTAVQPAAPIERPSGLAPRVEQTPTTNTGFALGKVSTDMPPPAPLVSPADAQAPAPVAGLGAAPTAPAAPAPAPVAPATEPAAAAPAPASAPAAGLAAAPAVAAPQQVGASNFAYSLNRTFQFEGGLNRADTNGQPSLYGINKQYHPDFFENPTKENAAKIYYEQYWKGVGADKMDPKLAHVAFDTAVIAGVDRTRRLLEQAGGDPYKLLELRKQFTDSLIARDPDKYGKYAKAWDNRVRTLASDISGEGGMPTQFAGIGAGGAGLPQPGERQGLAAALPSEQRASPFRTLAEGSFPNMPEALKSEKLVVPLLGGLAAMLASNKPNLGQALGEGLAGALSAYSDMYTRAPQVEGIEAGTERTRVETNAASFFTDREGRGRVTYRAPDGSVRTIDLAEWIGLKDKPPLDARSERLAREYAESKGIPFSPSGTGLGAAVTPAAAGTTTAAPTGGLGTAVPLPAAPYIALPTEIASDGQRRARELFSAGTSAVASLPGADLMKQQTEAAKAAQDIRPKQATLATSISALPLNGSLLTPGEPARILAPVAAAMNGLLTAAGGQPFVDPADLASKEGIDKIKNQLAQTASSAAGQRAYQAFSEILAAIPSNINSREGAARLLGELYVVNQREIDRENFFRQYRDSAAGPNGAYRLQANALGGEAEAAFNRIYPPERYNEEKAAIVRMMQTSPGNAPMNEAGRPMSWLEYMHKYGSTLSAEQRAAVRNTFSKESPDVLRFFGIGS